jgi:hypothetical protein
MSPEDSDGEGAYSHQEILDNARNNITGLYQKARASINNRITTIRKIDIEAIAAEAEVIESKADLLKLIARVRTGLAVLEGISNDDRDDIKDMFRKAEKAGKEDKKERLLDKLDAARQILLKSSESSPEALQLSQAIDTLIARVKQVL